MCCFGSVIVGTGRDQSVLDGGSKNKDTIISNVMISDSSNDAKVMQLNQYGLIVAERILWLEKQYAYVDVHNFVVMPNHIHLLLEIDSQKVKDFDVKIKSLSSLVGAFKTTSSKAIHETGFESFLWHRSFHDHIVRNELSYNRIDHYITLNPDKWSDDTFYETQ